MRLRRLVYLREEEAKQLLKINDVAISYIFYSPKPSIRATLYKL